MANPRKFSEKIALLQQKEQEGTAEYEKIMREVSEATAKVTQTRNKNLIVSSSLTAAIRFRGGSLPQINNNTNFNNIDNDNNTNNDKINDKENEMCAISGGFSPDNNPHIGRSGSIGAKDHKDSSMLATSTRESRGRSVGPMRPGRKIDTSPYNSHNAYLSPPSDSWRRTSSDSAIHTSLTQSQEGHVHLSPRHAHKRLSSSQNSSMKNIHHQQPHHQNSSSTQNILMHHNSQIPGINIYPSSQQDDPLQIHIQNTGSLPDLTQMHYQSPLSAPLDTEQEQLVTSSINTNYNQMPMASTNQTNQLNMGLYMNNNNNENLTGYSPKHCNKIPSSQGLPLNSNFNHQQSAPIAIDQTRHNSQNQQQHSPLHQSYLQQNHIINDKMNYRNTSSPTNLSSSQGNINKNLSGYRSPHNRPSPGSSPSIIPGMTTNFDSNSSAPCSPSPQMTGNNGQFDQFSGESFFIHPSILQPFEQFSLADTSMNDYIAPTSNDQNFSSLNDNGYNSLSSPMLDTSGQQQHHQQHHQQQQSPTQQQQHSPTSSLNSLRNNTINNNQNPNTSSNGTLINNNSHNNVNNNTTSDSLIGNNNMINSYNYDSNLSGGNGVNDILLSGGSISSSMDSNARLMGTNSGIQQSSSPLLTNTSPSHLINPLGTPDIPHIVLTDYSSEINELSKDFFMGETFRQIDMDELQMFNDNTIDPTIEDTFRRDLP